MFDGRFRSGVDRAVKPIGGALRRTGLSPDHLTALGPAVGRSRRPGPSPSGRLGLGLGLLIGSAVPDLLDGALAKASGRASVRGAFFDSVCDRVTDTLVLGGIAWYLLDRYHGHVALLPMAVLGASLLVSSRVSTASRAPFRCRSRPRKFTKKPKPYRAIARIRAPPREARAWAIFSKSTSARGIVADA